MEEKFKTSNQREYLKCGKSFIGSQFRDWKFLNQFNKFCHPNNWSKLLVYCLKFVLKLLKKHVAGTNSHKKAKNTNIIKAVQ